MTGLLKLPIPLALVSVMLGCNQGHSSRVDHMDKTDTVVINQLQFVPAEIEVEIGTTLVFVNNDIVDHNVVQIDSTWWSPILKPQDHWNLKVMDSATYYCSLHVVMAGKISLEVTK